MEHSSHITSRTMKSTMSTSTQTTRQTSSNRFRSPYKTVYPICHQMKRYSTKQPRITLLHSRDPDTTTSSKTPQRQETTNQKTEKETLYGSTHHLTTTSPPTSADISSIWSSDTFPDNISTTRSLTKIMSKLVTVVCRM